MGYLLLSVTAGFFMGMLVKYAESLGEDSTTVIAANYLTAFLPALAYLLWQQETQLSTSTFWYGVGGGILWPGAFLILLFGIRHYGIAISVPLSRMSIAVPAVFGLLALGEQLSWQLAAGLTLTIMAVLLMAPQRHSGQPVNKTFIWYALISFAAFGTNLLWTNLFTRYGGPGENFQYITGVFLWSIPFSWAYVWWRKIKITGRALLIGGVVGIGNFMSLLGNVMGLQSATFIDSSAVYYTIHGGLGTLAIFLGGAYIWSEPVNGRNWLGIAASICALILLNLN